MLSDPNMSLAEFIEKVGDLELQPYQRDMIEKLQAIQAAGGSLVLHMPPGRGRQDYLRSLHGGFREKDTLTGEVRDAPGDDRRWDSDPWSRGRDD